MNYGEAAGMGLAFGIANMAHCAGMCGPFAIHAATRTQKSVWANFSAYFGGKTFSYIFLGAVAGYAGARLSLTNELAKSMLGCFAAAMTLIAAISFIAGPPETAAASGAVQVLSRMRPQNPSMNSLSGFAFGAVTGLIPCGVVYLAVVQGAATGSVLQGIVLMAAFALGTGPVLAALGISGRALLGRMNAGAWKWAGMTILLATAGITLWRSLYPWVSGSGMGKCCG